MTDFYKKWLLVWTIGVAGFGAILTLGAFEATVWPVRLLMEFLNPALSYEPSPHLNFFLAVMGPVTLGWALTIYAALQGAYALEGQPAAKTVWTFLTAGVIGWFVIDSILSVMTGFPRNVAPNTLYLVGYLIPVIRSGVLRS